ncbi:alpha-amylase family glycosyl hydrolase, partial [Salmonella enterica subsp. enterica serovar Anatum]|nr:alpha-amylase family glycosyl hydrolase [Salmonella enterica subsp. enterica serovar Anatum]
VLLHIAGRTSAKEKNATLIEAIKSAKLPHDRYQTTTIVNTDDNQLDSHDTARFKTLLGKDAARLPLAVVWLFTWPGVPCIYYGD